MKVWRNLQSSWWEFFLKNINDLNVKTRFVVYKAYQWCCWNSLKSIFPHFHTINKAKKIHPVSTYDVDLWVLSKHGGRKRTFFFYLHGVSQKVLDISKTYQNQWEESYNVSFKIDSKHLTVWELLCCAAMWSHFQVRQQKIPVPCFFTPDKAAITRSIAVGNVVIKITACFCYLWRYTTTFSFTSLLTATTSLKFENFDFDNYDFVSISQKILPRVCYHIFGTSKRII